MIIYSHQNIDTKLTLINYLFIYWKLGSSLRLRETKSLAASLDNYKHVLNWGRRILKKSNKQVVRVACLSHC